MSDAVGNPQDWFSRDAAHLIVLVLSFSYCKLENFDNGIRILLQNIQLWSKLAKQA